MRERQEMKEETPDFHLKSPQFDLPIFAFVDILLEISLRNAFFPYVHTRSWQLTEKDVLELVSFDRSSKLK